MNPLYNRQLGYDRLNRLVTADGAWGSGAFRYGVRGDIVQKTLGSSVTDYVYNGLKLVKVNQNLYYGYDIYGNIQSEDVLLASGFSGPSFINLKTYTYDDAGNLRQIGRRWGKLIETVGSHLTERHQIAKTRARDLWHYPHRLIRKVLSHTVCVFINLQSGRSPLDLSK